MSLTGSLFALTRRGLRSSFWWAEASFGEMRCLTSTRSESSRRLSTRWLIGCSRFAAKYGVERSFSAEDAGFWEAARLEAPKWALFQRLSLSDDDREFLESVGKNVEKAFEMLCGEADEVTVSDKGDGTEEISVTFDLTKEKDR
jgi:hypothetical protein